MWQKFYYSEKGSEKASDLDIGRGTESAPLTSLNIYLKLTRLELTIEMFYQTHTHNTCLKITRSVRWFLLRRNLSSSKYIVILIKTKNVGKKSLSFSPP